MPTRSTPWAAPWPVVPRPFEGEAFGSWFGRIAGRYRIGVDELASAAGVSLDEGGRAWLASQAPQGEALVRLAALCRLPADTISSMGPSTSISARRLWYCYPCLDLNVRDVFSPYWRAAWLSQDGAPCAAHPGDTWWIFADSLQNCRNMHKLVRTIRQRMQVPMVREARRAAGLYPYASRLCGPRHQATEARK